MDKNNITKIRNNDHRALARMITRIEENRDVDNNFYNEIYPYTQKAIRIGITGPPGAGKSTLIDHFIKIALAEGKSVGVVAVDPTSPFTGGALLGDRVRMNKFAGNDNVYIRSMGSRGDLGGLARKAQDVGDLLAVSGKDIVIFETVGVGQGEYDIIKIVDIAVVVLVPESGDEVQLMKAGLVEIADFFVINKSDRSGANRLAATLKSLLHMNHSSNRLEPPVFNTIASKGEGVNEFYNGLFTHLQLINDKGLLTKKKMEQHRHRVFTLIQNELLNDFWTSKRLKELENITKSLESMKYSAYKIANQIMNETK